MGSNWFWNFLSRVCTVIAVSAALVTSSSAASNYGLVYVFTGGNDGGNSATAITFDAAGNAYGTTVIGGIDNCGTVFKISPAGSESVLWNFDCFGGGKSPHGGVTLDGSGNIYGTTVAGGSGPICTFDGCGIVYEITTGGSEVILHNFQGNKDGFGPGSAVVFDSAGNLYGETPDGGAYGKGTVFKLLRSGSTFKHRVIHSFTGGADGAIGSLGSLRVDTSGNLYGVTEIGGLHRAGIAFKMSPMGAGNWSFTSLYNFKNKPDAGFPYGGLIADRAGNLYGTTYFGGANGVGSVFVLSPGSSGYTERVLYSFKGGTDGSLPTSTLVFDAANDLLGTTSAGGNPGCDCGTVFKLAHTTMAESILHKFGTRLDGSFPYYGLTAGPAGGLFSSTNYGGSHSEGVIFKVTP